MPSIIPKSYFCAKCKKEISKKNCNCGTKGKPQPPYSVRFRWIDEEGITRNMRITDESGRGWQTQSAAQRGYDDWIAKHPTHKKTETRVVNFLPLYEEWKAHIRVNMKESSGLAYIQRMDRYVAPYFRDHRVTEITRADIVKWKNMLSEKPLSTRYKNCIQEAFHHFFAYLAMYGIQNPLTGVKGFKDTSKKKEMLFWTQEEFEQFIACVDVFRYKVVFAFLYLTGCRKGEALALRWSDIDFKEHTANIHGTLSKDTDKERDISEGERLSELYRLTTPKSENGYRKVILPTRLLEYLKKWKEECSSEFVFGARGTFLSFNTLEHAFDRYTKKAGVKDIRIHDLRHSHVALLINKGGDNQLATVYIIADRIGDTPEMVFKTYGHLFPSQQHGIVPKLDFDF